ncbi:MAG: TonB family protein [Gemmatimonadota bacterium]
MQDTATLTPAYGTANDRLKQRFSSYFWASLSLAAVLHFLVLALAPSVMAEDYSVDSTEMEQIEVPLEVEIPPPPEQIVRPAVPLMSSSVDFDTDLTIDPTIFSEVLPSDLPPPPVGSPDISDEPRFTPYEVRPEFRNRDEYARALVRRYPPTLRDAGIGGSVLLWVFIDETGSVQTVRVTESSGYEQLDEVAETVVREVARFTPALNRDERVPVWIQIPVVFQAR